MPDEKLVLWIIFNKDLKMSKGKAVAQGCHAAVLATTQTESVQLGNWLEGNQPIVSLMASEPDIANILMQLGDSNVTPVTVTDAGLTQIPSETLTCIGVGPCYRSDLGGALDTLKLYS